MTEQEWRITVSETLGRIESKLDNVCGDVSGIEKTLYGAEGRTGLVHEVQEIKSNQGTWNRGLAIMSLLLTAAVSALGYFFKWGK